MNERWPNHIRYYRKRQRLSLEKLGAALEEPTSKGTMSQYETGERTPSLGRLYQIATALNCRPGEILDGPRDGEDFGAAHAPPPQWFPKPETIAELLAFVMRVDEDDSARRAELLVYGNALHTALKWLADDPDRDENQGVVRQIGKRIADEIESGRIAPSQAS